MDAQDSGNAVLDSTVNLMRGITKSDHGNYCEFIRKIHAVVLELHQKEPNQPKLESR